MSGNQEQWRSEIQHCILSTVTCAAVYFLCYFRRSAECEYIRWWHRVIVTFTQAWHQSQCLNWCLHTFLLYIYILHCNWLLKGNLCFFTKIFVPPNDISWECLKNAFDCIWFDLYLTAWFIYLILNKNSIVFVIVIRVAKTVNDLFLSSLSD